MPRLFENTPLGHFLKMYANSFYVLVTESLKGTRPSADLIEQLSYASDDPVFRLEYFRVCLMDYRKRGLHSRKKVRELSKSEMLMLIDLRISNEKKRKKWD